MGGFGEDAEEVFAADFGDFIGGEAGLEQGIDDDEG